MEDERLQVSDELDVYAAQLQNATERLWQAICQIERKINGTKGYWYGRAGANCRSAFAGVLEEAKQVCGSLRGYPGRLSEAAGIYAAAEEENREMTGLLKQKLL